MKIRKNIIAVIMSGLMLVNIISLPVHAAVAVVETEPNNTRENAMLIQANRETASGTVTGSNPGHYAVEGSTSANDDDWYKELPENNLRILFRVNLIKSVNFATGLRRLFGGIS